MNSLLNDKETPLKTLSGPRHRRLIALADVHGDNDKLLIAIGAGLIDPESLAVERCPWNNICADR